MRSRQKPTAPGRLTRPARRLPAVAALAVVIAGALAACGGSAPGDQAPAGSRVTGKTTTALTTLTAARTSTAAKTSAAAKTSTAGSSAVAHAKTVKVIHSQYGRILGDGSGHALYLFTRDRTSSSRCAGECAGHWPPFVTRSGVRAGAGAQAALLGTHRRRDGTLQVTYAGHPLYFYVGDRRPGQVLCQDVEEFGGRWYVVTRRGSAVL